MTDKEVKPEGNFIDKCRFSFSDEGCLSGLSVFFISLIPLLLNILAFYKMTKFYEKMNFENTIILLSIIQTIIMQSVLLTSIDLFFEIFFLVQIFIITLIIRKFQILAGGTKTFFNKNGAFVILNICNVVIFLIYPLYANVFTGHHLYVKLFYRIFHAITTCILSYYCCFFIQLVVKYKENYIKSYHSLYESNLIDLGNINNENDTSASTNSKTTKKGEKFYSKKKKQIRYLYIVNLFCAVFEICFTILRNFIWNEHFLNYEQKTIPNSITGEIIYYIYIIVCLINVSANYLCFYFFIRHQYNYKEQKAVLKPEKTLLDENYIENQEDMRKSSNPDVNQFLFNAPENEKEGVRKESEEDIYFPDLDPKKTNNLLPETSS